MGQPFDTEGKQAKICLPPETKPQLAAPSD